MSSITSEHALGTAAHLPPGGLVAIAWCSVGVAGGFGEWACCFFLGGCGGGRWGGFLKAVCKKCFVGMEKEEEKEEIASDVIRDCFEIVFDA